MEIEKYWMQEESLTKMSDTKGRRGMKGGSIILLAILNSRSLLNICVKMLRIYKPEVQGGKTNLALSVYRWY